jgi:hypothetical protein
LDVLFGYMQSTAVSPLQRDFVQLAEPFCSLSLFVFVNVH